MDAVAAVEAGAELRLMLASVPQEASATQDPSCRLAGQRVHA